MTKTKGCKSTFSGQNLIIAILQKKRAVYTVDAVSSTFICSLKTIIIYDLSTGELPSQDYVRITLQIVSIT